MKLRLLRLKEQAQLLLSYIVPAVRRHPVYGEIYEAIDGVLGDYFRDHGPIYAGALAFYAVLSLIPLLLLFASLAAFIVARGDGHQMEKAIHEGVAYARAVIPYLEPRFADDLLAIVRHRRGLSVVGLFALLASAGQVFRALEFALARIFARLSHDKPTDKGARPRNVLSSKLLFGVTIIAMVLGYAAIGFVSRMLRVVAQRLELPVWLLDLLHRSAIGSWLGRLATSLALLVGFVFLVKFFTKARIPTRFAAVGGVVFVVGFNVAQWGFDFYVGRVTNLGSMYGPFAAIVVVVLWMYFGSTLLLLCCHVTKMVQRRMTVGPRYLKDERPRLEASPPSADPQ